MQPRRMVIGIVTGIVAGLAAKLLGGGAAWIAWITENVAGPVGQIFLRLLFMLIIPLLFSALVVAIAGLDLRGVARLGGRTLAYTLMLSAVAVVIGMGLVNLVQPGAGARGSRGGGHDVSGRIDVPPPGLPPRADARGEEVAPRVEAGSVGGGHDVSARNGVPLPEVAPRVEGGSPSGFLVRLVPDNPVKAAASGDLIGVIIFSLVFGIGLAATRTAEADRVRELMQGLYDVSMTCIGGVLRVAPIGVGALLFVMAMRLGGQLVAQLAAYVGVVLVGMVLHMFLVYPLVLRVFAGRGPFWFFHGVRLAIATAFSTSSSSATLPTSLKVAEEELKLPPPVSRFVLTVGATMNQNGTALFEGVTVLFLAQFYGVPLGFGQQALVMVISLLAGVGTAGVPAGSLPVMAMVLAIFGIPTEGVALILGVDRLLDMCRTTLNVTGDLVLAVCITGRHHEK